MTILVFSLAFAIGIATVIYNDGNSIEKDRILVTYLSFLIIIVFWGSFEQAGGLMNVYAKQKTDLSLFGFFEVPAVVVVVVLFEENSILPLPECLESSGW